MVSGRESLVIMDIDNPSNNESELILVGGRSILVQMTDGSAFDLTSLDLEYVDSSSSGILIEEGLNTSLTFPSVGTATTPELVGVFQVSITALGLGRVAIDNIVIVGAGGNGGGGNDGGGQAGKVNISENALDAHLNHGDALATGNPPKFLCEIPK